MNNWNSLSYPLSDETQVKTFLHADSAGLIPALALGLNKPRGDMDVMFSIQTQQGIVTTPPNR